MHTDQRSGGQYSGDAPRPLRGSNATQDAGDGRNTLKSSSWARQSGLRSCVERKEGLGRVHGADNEAGQQRAATGAMAHSDTHTGLQDGRSVMQRMKERKDRRRRRSYVTEECEVKGLWGRQSKNTSKQYIR